MWDNVSEWGTIMADVFLYELHTLEERPNGEIAPVIRTTVTSVDSTPDQDEACPGCGRTYYRACRQEHQHDVYCIDIDETRQYPCGCYGHKECTKSGQAHDCRSVAKP